MSSNNLNEISTATSYRSTRIKVIVADTSGLVLLGARQVLGRAGIEIEGETTSCSDLLSLLDHRHCDMLILDPLIFATSLPPALALIKLINRRYPSMRILLFTDLRPEVSMPFNKLGVVALLDKAAPLSGLPAAIYSVASGGYYQSEVLLALS
ncbi:hypothetical protein [Dyella sp. Tek66A03]|uniref:hypothetical protein n=1 Tax=Dyella sp. Tek66A03 TaxID=3458298 RepID=UPI00403ED051